MKYWNKETRSESGEYYRDGDWSVNRPEGWDNGRGNFTTVAPPDEAFDGIPYDWDAGLDDWVCDVPGRALVLLERSDPEFIKAAARSIEDELKDRIAAGRFVSQAVKDRIAEREALRADL